MTMLRSAALFGALAATVTISTRIPVVRSVEAEVPMHLRLTKSNPAKDSTVATMPRTIQLWYSQEPQLKLSSVTLTGPGGTIALGKVAQDSTDNTLLTAAVEGSTPAGAYKISWRTASADGHPIRGEIPFTVR